MSLGGGVNLPREPRNGRTFEYQGEDPLLAGTLAGNFVKGVQSAHIIGDLKHYALNDQESGRNAVNANIDKRSMRETDLRAFEIALGHLRCRRRHVLLQPRQRRLCLRKQLSAHRRAEEGLPLPGLCALRLGRHALRRQGLATPASTRSSPTSTSLATTLKKAVESGEVSQDETQRSRASHPAHHLCHRPLRQSGQRSRFRTWKSGYAVAQSMRGKEHCSAQERAQCTAPGGQSALRGADRRPRRRGRPLRRRLGAGGCARRLRCSSSASGQESHGSLHASGVVAQFAAARADGQLCPRPRFPTSPATIWPPPLPLPNRPMWPSSSPISGSRKAWTCPR